MASISDADLFCPEKTTADCVLNTWWLDYKHLDTVSKRKPFGSQGPVAPLHCGDRHPDIWKWVNTAEKGHATVILPRHLVTHTDLMVERRLSGSLSELWTLVPLHWGNGCRQLKVGHQVNKEEKGLSVPMMITLPPLPPPPLFSSNDDHFAPPPPTNIHRMGLNPTFARLRSIKL